MEHTGSFRPLSPRLWARILLSCAALALCVPTAHAARYTLTISGTPPTSVTAGQSYSFTPTAIDTHTHSLVFAIANQPTWASFSSSTGQLSGTPGSGSVGSYSNIVIAVSDGTKTASLPAFTVQVLASATSTSSTTTSTTIVLSGTPPTSVTAGSTYAFQPTASDSGGKLMSFSVQNKPDWAGFSIATGQLDGTPSSVQTGTYANVVISASDGTTSSALPAFSITVTSPPATTGSAVLALTPPTQNTDGSTLTDLAGMRVYYGTSASSLSQVVDLAGTTTATSYTLANLASGTWYFAATAYDTSGQESSPSATASKSIP
jgi:putative Ig domain-containing protein